MGLNITVIKFFIFSDGFFVIGKAVGDETKSNIDESGTMIFHVQ